jgi:hypothetical protein
LSVGKSLYTTSNIWHAAALAFCFTHECLAKVVIIDKFKAEWSFAIPYHDAELTIAEYEKDELALSSARQFVHEYNLLAQRQRKMKARGEDQYVSEAWIRGDVG